MTTAEHPTTRSTAQTPLCVLLHAGLNTAVGVLALTDHGAVVVGALALTAVTASAALVVLTHGRLGLPATPTARP